MIATDEINVRSGPGLSHEIVSVVSRNESYPILEERGDWVQIQLNGGQKGWVVSWLIKKKSQVSSGSDSASGKVTSSEANLRIRKGPGTSYEVQGVFPEGEQADLLKTDGKWIKISYQNITGWVYSDYVNQGSGAKQSQSSSSHASSSKSGTVGVSTLNVRSTASHQGRIIATLQRNASVTILNEQHGWYEIEFNGQKGWAASHYILEGNKQNSGTSETSVTPKQNGRPPSCMKAQMLEAGLRHPQRSSNAREKASLTRSSLQKETGMKSNCQTAIPLMSQAGSFRLLTRQAQPEIRKARHRLWQSGQAREAQSKIKRLSSMPDMEDMTAGQSERGGRSKNG